MARDVSGGRKRRALAAHAERAVGAAGLDQAHGVRFSVNAAEELVAELGAAFLTAHLGLGCEPREDHAPYIASWLRLLRNDPKAIVTAASKAQAAADYLIDLANPAANDDAVPSSDAQASRQPEREAA